MTSTSPGQDPGTSDPAPGPAPAGLIWTRPPTEKRERPTREAIVAAAVDLADTHGLDAVSIRRVAAALKTRPMDLYRYFTRKDELIDLMVDEVIAGAVLDEIPPDWRDALAAIARALRAVCLAHPVDGHRGRAAGPARAERHAPRRAVARSDRRARPGPGETTSHLARRGLLHHGPRPHPPRPGSQRRHHRTRPRPAGRGRGIPARPRRLGNFPNLAALGVADLLHNDHDELTFETGLDWLLTGIAADT